MLGLGKFLHKGPFWFLDHKRLKNNVLLHYLKMYFLLDRRCSVVWRLVHADGRLRVGVRLDQG
jgi:hypothetical protein